MLVVHGCSFRGCQAAIRSGVSAGSGADRDVIAARCRRAVDSLTSAFAAIAATDAPGSFAAALATFAAVFRVSERAHQSGVDAALCARRILARVGQVVVFVWGGTSPMEGMRRPSR